MHCGCSNLSACRSLICLSISFLTFQVYFKCTYYVKYGSKERINASWEQTHSQKSLPAGGEGVLGWAELFGSGRGTSTTAWGSRGRVLERDFRGRVFAPDASALCLASAGSGEVRPAYSISIEVNPDFADR